MLATTLGIEFDPDKDYDERKEIFRMSGRIINTRSITQTAKGNKNALWTTVIAAAVLLP
jgi:arginine decarboxylase